MDNIQQPNNNRDHDTVINNEAPSKGSMLAGFIILLIIAAILVLIMRNRSVDTYQYVPVVNEQNEGMPAQGETTSTAEESAAIQSDLETMDIDGISDGI
jgi:hypothetical protein